MTMNNLMYVTETFWRVLEHNPGRLVPIVATASAITLVIAVLTDAWLRARPPETKKVVVQRSGTTFR